MKNNVELLAPAGNMESLKAAVSAGCNAVYLGLQSFSARAFAGNFSHEDFIEAIAYCHIRDVKIYVTMNTMLYETEIANAVKEVDFLYDHDVDGLLIQDLGLLHYVRTCYPDLDVHCSTQMHIHNLAGVNYMKQLGVKRVVAARETPIELVKKMCDTGMDIEVFVYGAICISYSGQCLMSSAVKQRSANRGMCAQCCRLKYFNGNQKFKEGDYVLSPKDLNVIDHIPELLDAGVASLKIEGRMKRPEYVWLVTRTFREAIDAYQQGRAYHVDADRLNELMLMFNRGFSKGHLFHASVAERMSQYRPNHQGVQIGTVLKYQNGRVQVKLTSRLNQHDGLRILNEPEDTGLTAVKIYDAKDRLVNHGEAGDTVWLDCRSKPDPRPGQPLHKTSDAVLIQQIDAQAEHDSKRFPINIQYQAEEGHPFVLELTDEHGHHVSSESDILVQQAKSRPLTSQRIEESIAKLNDTPYCIGKITGSIGNIFIPISAINETRREAIDALDHMRAVQHVRSGRLAYHVQLIQPPQPDQRILIQSSNSFGYGDHQIRPVVNENYDEPIPMDHVILSSYCDLAGEHHACTAGLTMNIANSYAAAFLYTIKGIDGAVLSSEMDDDNIKAAVQAFEARYGFTPYFYRLVSGRRTVMYIKDCFSNDPSIHTLTDLQGEQYQVLHRNGITEIKEPHSYQAERGICFGEYQIIDEGEK